MVFWSPKVCPRLNRASNMMTFLKGFYDVREKLLRSTAPCNYRMWRIPNVSYTPGISVWVIRFYGCHYTWILQAWRSWKESKFLMVLANRYVIRIVFRNSIVNLLGIFCQEKVEQMHIRYIYKIEISHIWECLPRLSVCATTVACHSTI